MTSNHKTPCFVSIIKFYLTVIDILIIPKDDNTTGEGVEADQDNDEEDHLGSVR